MDTNDATLPIADSESGRFHTAFDSVVRKIMEPVRDNMIDSVPDIKMDLNANTVIAQVLMNLLSDAWEGGNPEQGRFPIALKARFIEMADHMGPDWAQALYHAAVFITKVA